MTDVAVEAVAAIPELIAAAMLVVVSIRAAKPKRPAMLALIIGACVGSAMTLLVERAIGAR